MYKTICTTIALIGLLALPARSAAQNDPSAYDPEELLSVDEMRAQRGLTELGNAFVPKGQWIAGINGSYSTHENDSYNFLVIEDIESSGYTFRISPLVAYAIRDNMAIGIRGTYARTNLMLDNAALVFGDDETGTSLAVDNYFSIKHSYTIAVSWRQYIPLGKSKRFALFNEVQLGAGGTQSKFAAGQPLQGTYESGYTLSLGVSPGMLAFATNNLAVEVNVGVMGLSYTDVKQNHNRVSTGRRRSSAMNFKINIFTVGVGVAFYL